tara:strand:+ start:429 stop:659 length:231 start_codon:yes stop_codon:yes gene_type:complete
MMAESKQLTLFPFDVDDEGNYRWQAIDWDLVHQQKLELLENCDTPLLEGLVALIDSLQDYAVDILGIWEFPKEREE